jgi:uncharacterized protein YutE (UPF0331/DUF86 family)
LVDREVFDRRLARLEQLLRHLRRAADLDKKTFLGDPMATASTERWLQLASECALDLAHHVIADRGWKTPSTYREAFQILCDEGALSPDLAAQMKQWAGLRNVLVHLYLEVDYERLYEILQRDLDQLEDFAAGMRRAVDEP